jgi:16S rRNA U516 pseudouridylate synthase RsuA-like enzyme
MFDAINVKISSLKRTKIGSVSIEGLSKGKWRHLTKEEVESFN